MTGGTGTTGGTTDGTGTTGGTTGHDYMVQLEAPLTVPARLEARPEAPLGFYWRYWLSPNELGVW